MKKSKYAKRRLCAVLIFVFIILLFICIFLKIRNKKVDSSVSLLLNNEIYSNICEIIVDEENNVFLSKGDVKNIFDTTLYYNTAEKELISTYNTHVASIKIDNDKIIINNEEERINAVMHEVNGIIYIPISELDVLYDIEVEYSESNNLVIIDSLLCKKEKANISEKTNLKKWKFAISKTIETLNSGSEVYILKSDEHYTKIRSKNGNIGYVSTERLTNLKVIRESAEEKNYNNIVIYSNYSNPSGIYENVPVDVKAQNFVIPTFFYLDAGSKILDKTASSTAVYSNYKGWLDLNKIEIVATIENNESVSNSLLTFSQRSEVIQKICEKLERYKFKGLNVNFKSIDDVNSFYRFLIELKPILKSKDLILVVTFNSYMDVDKIENIADYIIK